MADTQPATSRIALNPSTIRGYELPIVEQIEVAAEAGYQGVEPWLRDLVAYMDAGGDLAELRRRIADAGLQVVDGIAFFNWAHTDSAVRDTALEDAKREMAVLSAIGGEVIAAPPFGDVADLTLDQFAEYYRDLMAVGRETGVMPLLELWGHAPRLSTLHEVLYVAAACGEPNVRFLLDVYHLYRGGNSFDSLGLVSGAAIGLIHINDYPAAPAREDIADPDRVWPGDGIAPFPQILDTLDRAGFSGMFSVELFNPSYWQSDPLTTARTGLEKTRAVLGAAG